MEIDYPYTIKEYLSGAVWFVVRKAIYTQNLDRAFYDSVIHTIDYHTAENCIRAKVGSRNGNVWQYDINVADKTIDAAFLEVVHTDVAAWFLMIKNGQEPTTSLDIVTLSQGNIYEQ